MQDGKFAECVSGQLLQLRPQLGLQPPQQTDHVHRLLSEFFLRYDFVASCLFSYRAVIADAVTPAPQ
jgi:hypothetical protein